MANRIITATVIGETMTNGRDINIGNGGNINLNGTVTVNGKPL